MTAIVDIIGREILDSRGNPTVEVDVVLEARWEVALVMIGSVDLVGPISKASINQSNR